MALVLAALISQHNGHLVNVTCLSLTTNSSQGQYSSRLGLLYVVFMPTCCWRQHVLHLVNHTCPSLATNGSQGQYSSRLGMLNVVFMPTCFWLQPVNAREGSTQEHNWARVVLHLVNHTCPSHLNYVWLVIFMLFWCWHKLYYWY